MPASPTPTYLPGTPGAATDTDRLPQLYQLARKNRRVASHSSTEPDGGPPAGTNVQLAVRKARSRFFGLPPEDVAGSHPVEKPEKQHTERPPGNTPPPPHTVEALAGAASKYMPLPSNTGLPTNTEPPVQQGYATAPEPARSPVPQAPPSLPGAELNPADPVNLRALLGQAETPLNQQETKEAETLLRAALTGLGPLEPLLATPELTDIFVNGTEVWFEAAGTLKRSEITLENDDETRALAVRLLTAAGGRLDDAHPIADAQTHTGLRVHAVLSPLSRKGTLLSIRARATNTPTLENLRQRGMFPHSTEQLLRYLVETRANFLISGGTGTGKTTLLSALLGACGHQDRLLLVEDTAELAPEHPHAVSLQAREANTEGRGEVSLAELIRAALRMRPTRLIVGECRGAEVVDMLTAMNTGHSGTGATVHANSAAAVPARLYAMGALGGLSQEALALQAATALDYIVHIDRCGGERKIRELARLELHEGQLTAVPVARTETGRRGDYLHWLPAGTGLKADFEEWGTP